MIPLLLPSLDTHANSTLFLFNGELKDYDFASPCQPHHLYWVQQEPLQVRDWYLTIRKDYIGQPAQCVRIHNSQVISQLMGSTNPQHNQFTEVEFAYKIIATTNSHLHLFGVAPILPFAVQQYIKDYNQGLYC